MTDRVLRRAASPDGSDVRVMFLCPGCCKLHSVRVAGDHAWGWNGDMVRPTFTPSILVRSYTWDGTGEVPTVCHSFVRDGRVEFLSDCTHALAGQTVLLPADPTGC